jgi:multiple sugar transport system permease protein
MLPFMVGMIVFYLYPIISAFTHSFTKWTGYTAAVFTGLQNYSTAIDDPLLRKELYNTIRYILLSLPLSIGVALVFAELLNSKIRGRGFYRVLFYLPNITMSVVVVLVWRMLLNTRFGLITMAVKAIFGNCPSFLADPEYVMYTMVMMSVWTSMGYNIIYLLAGLQSIPETYFEACRVDGGNAFACFFRIKLPLITPTLFYLAVTGVISGFNQFDYAFLLSTSAAGGGALSMESPVFDALRTVVTGIYNSGFIFGDMGYACAKAIILFIIILIVTVFQFKVQKKWVNY